MSQAQLDVRSGRGRVASPAKLTHCVCTDGGMRTAPTSPTEPSCDLRNRLTWYSARSARPRPQ